MLADSADRIEALCRVHGVRALHLIGSATDGTFDAATSDVDFLVEFLADPPGGLFKAYFGLRDGLESLLRRRVDLVCNGPQLSPYFVDSVEASKVPLYAAA